MGVWTLQWLSHWKAVLPEDWSQASSHSSGIKEPGWTSGQSAKVSNEAHEVYVFDEVCTRQGPHSSRHTFSSTKNPYLAMLAYRSTPLQNGFSPAELLMSRRLCTTIPIVHHQLKPSVLDYEIIKVKEDDSKRNKKNCLIPVIECRA